MEASLISFLLDKLSGLKRILVDQAQRTPPLDQICARLDRITAEFKVTKAFLEGSIWSTIAVANEHLEAWIEQVRAVALKVEDIIDGYLYQVREQHERTWKYDLSRPSNLCFDLAEGIDSQLEATEKEILNLLDMRVGFGLRLSGNEDKIDSKKDTRHYQVYSPMLIDEDDLVGIEANKNKLLSWLTDADTCKQMKTIAIWGMDGLERTTLVSNVYRDNTVKRHFDCQVWVTIPQNYSVEEILRRIILEIFQRKTESILKGITSMTQSKLLATIQESLQLKRYIVVLDDFWDEKLWENIQNAFVDSNNGSRLVVTTRKDEVAKIASQLHQLNKVAKMASQQHNVELQQLDEVAANIVSQLHQFNEAAEMTSQQHNVELQQLDEVVKIASQLHMVEPQQLNEVAKIESQLQQFNEVTKIASQQYNVELQQLNEVSKIASQLQQLDEVAKKAKKLHTVELQQFNEIEKVASQQYIVELQQLNEEAKKASQHHIKELQELDEVAKRASQQYIVELLQLNVTKIASQLQQLNEIAKIANQLQQFNEIAKIPSQLQELDEVAKRASQQYIVELLQLNVTKIASRLQQLNEIANIASQLQQFNEVAKIPSQLWELDEVAKRANQQYIVKLLQFNVTKIASQLQQLNEVAKIPSRQYIAELQRLNEEAKIASRLHIAELQRLNEVAKVEHTIKLQLNKKDAWILFCKKAFRRENSNDCPQELKDYACRILNKCQGSPLAIVAIGSVLSFKGKSKTEWKKVLDLLHWELENNPSLNEVKSILNLSFDDLPYYLKNCFVYCSIFPEDYPITRKKLIRLWVAEGFVAAKSNNRVMEEEAEDYLSELVDRSMLQVVQRNDFGRMKAFRMHDVIREVTLEISRKANFCMVLNGSQSVLDNSTRRIFIQTKDESLHLKRSLSQLSTLVMFSAFNFSPHSLRAFLSSLKMLRVLELEDASISNLPNEVSTLFNLHYLSLRVSEMEQLPHNIQKLQSLQTIDLRHSNIVKLPHGVTKLKQLRHLFVTEIEVEFAGTVVGCAPILGVALQWKNLQTLRSVKATMKLVQLLGNMKELRSLEILEVQQAHCPQLCTSLTKMRKLRCLRLFARGEEQLNFEMLNSPPPPLQKLDLSGRLFRGRMPTFVCSCAELVRVKLLWSHLTCDPLPTLEQLDNLVVLILGPRAYEGKKLHFRAGWFRNLKRLYLGGLMNLNNIEIDEGAMASFHEVVMAGLPELKTVPRGVPRGMQLINHRPCLSLLDKEDQ